MKQSTNAAAERIVTAPRCLSHCRNVRRGSVAGQGYSFQHSPRRRAKRVEELRMAVEKKSITKCVVTAPPQVLELMTRRDEDSPQVL